MVEPDCYVSGPSAHELGGTLNGVRGSWATATIEQRRSVCVQQHVVDESRGHRMDAYGKATVTDTRDCELHGAGGLSGSQHASLEAQGAPGAGRGMDMPLASEGVALSHMLPVQRGEAGGGSCGAVGCVYGGASTDLGLEGGQWSPWPIEWSYPTMVWDITVESSHLGQGSAAMPCSRGPHSHRWPLTGLVCKHRPRSGRTGCGTCCGGIRCVRRQRPAQEGNGGGCGYR